MATVSLGSAFRRLQVHSSPICSHCRRTLFSSARKSQQQQSATAALFQASQRQSAAQNQAPPNRTAPLVPPKPELGTSRTTTAEPDHIVPRSSYDLAASIIQDNATAKQTREAKERAARVNKPWDRSDLEKQAVRRWRVGDVYAPHDLTGVEQAKWKKFRKRGRQRYDVIDQLGINPIDHYKNFSVMSEFISDMGRIKHRNETGLRPVNQRRMAKAVRRAMGIGLMPGVHRHPEILNIERRARGFT